jgi:hypothetical protein
MERVRKVLLNNIEQKILHSKNNINLLDRRYKTYCSEKQNDEFCKINYFDPRNIQNKRIRIYQDRIEYLNKTVTLSIHDTEAILNIDINYIE